MILKNFPIILSLIYCDFFGVIIFKPGITNFWKKKKFLLVIITVLNVVQKFALKIGRITRFLFSERQN